MQRFDSSVFWQWQCLWSRPAMCGHSPKEVVKVKGSVARAARGRSGAAFFAG